ncbi:hypothetical protein [Burkholderia ambifaria]|uniref:hypothetical protein n=1 Tax=Burkholderia ambifaria TaxID=152480 RepID=UPI001589D636|nr:hypothetical protein [Burkholderia ambifaria]
MIGFQVYAKRLFLTKTAPSNRFGESKPQPRARDDGLSSESNLDARVQQIRIDRRQNETGWLISHGRPLVAPDSPAPQLAKRRTSRLPVRATGKLGQLKQQLYAGSMTTLSPEAFAGHTPMMQQYLRLI